MEHYTNYYKCPCGEEWEDQWSCMCNDRCPSCNKEIEPYDSRDNWDGLPTYEYVVEAELVVPEEELDYEDRECLTLITTPYYMDACCADEILDAYHSNIPVSCLDDFEFDCHRVNEEV
jgi:hypothetical protein